MGETNIAAGFRGLAQSLSRIRTLLAWQELEEAEVKPDTPPGFRVNSHLAEDLRNFIVRFRS